MSRQPFRGQPEDGERWRPVPGFEDRYDISDRGRVYSRPANKFNRPRILKPWLQFGYQYVNLVDSTGKAKKTRVHRLVLLAFDRAPQPDEQVRHLNGVKTDNRLTNLAWGSAKENAQDNLRLGVHHNARKTHCPRRHEYTAENTGRGRPLTSGAGRGRVCLTCKRDRKRLARPGTLGTETAVATIGYPPNESTCGYAESTNTQPPEAR